MRRIVITVLGTLLLGIVPQHLNAQSAKPKPANVAVAIKHSPEKAPTEAELRKALEKPLAAEFENVPLDLILRQVAEAIGQNVVIDGQALREEGVAIDTPISHHGKPIAAARLLDRVLEPLGLTWVIEHHVISVTTIIAADEKYITRIYPVGDLLDYAKTHRQHVSETETQGLQFVQFKLHPERGGCPHTSPIAPPKELLADILFTMTDGPWMDVDAQGGSMSFIRHRLVIRQHQRTQEQCRQVLQSVREFFRKRLSKPIDIRPAYYPFHEDRLIEQKLEKVVIVKCKQVPFKQLLETLARKIDVPIHFNVPAIDDRGTSLDRKISFNAKNLTVSSTFDLILEPLGLVALVEDGRLLVTSIVESKEHFVTRIYDLRDLDLPEKSQLALSEIIQKATSGPWGRIDGIGGCIHNPYQGLLIVRQYAQVHDEIAGILDDFRRRDQEKAKATSLQESNKLNDERLHFVQFGNSQPLREPRFQPPGEWLIDLIEGMTSSLSWHDIDAASLGTMSLIKNRLVIRTTFRRQEKCARIIEALRQFTKGKYTDRAVAIRNWYYPPKEDQQVRKALEKVVTANFNELSLDRFLSIVSKAIDVPIHLDRHALKEEGVAIDEPISRDVKNVPARSLLTINLKPLGLCFVIEDGRVLVTTMIAAEERAYARFYDVRDLNQAGFETQKLLEVLQDETNGNWLTYANFGHNPRAPFDGLLAIYQTDRVHQEIEVILDSLRKPQPVER